MDPRSTRCGIVFRQVPDIATGLDGLADRLGVAPRVLRRAFQDAFGMAVKSWLVRHRLRGLESASEIAGSVGFSHAKELSREFRKVYQVTPAAYQLREREQGAGTARAGGLAWHLER